MFKKSSFSWRAFQADDVTRRLIDGTFNRLRAACRKVLHAKPDGVSSEQWQQDKVNLFNGLSQHIIEQLGRGVFEPEPDVTSEAAFVEDFVNKALIQMIYCAPETLPLVKTLRYAHLMCHQYQKGENSEAEDVPEDFCFYWSEVLIHPHDGSKSTLDLSGESDANRMIRGTRHATGEEVALYNGLEPAAIYVPMPEAKKARETKGKKQGAKGCGPVSAEQDASGKTVVVADADQPVALRYQRTVAFGKDRAEWERIYKGSKWVGWLPWLKKKQSPKKVGWLPYPKKASRITFVSPPLSAEQVAGFQHYVFKAIPCDEKTLAEQTVRNTTNIQKLEEKNQNTGNRVGRVEEELHLEREDKDLKIRQLFEKIAALDVNKVEKKDLQEMLEGLQEDFDVLRKGNKNLSKDFYEYKEKTDKKLEDLEELKKIIELIKYNGLDELLAPLRKTSQPQGISGNSSVFFQKSHCAKM